jgi:hypothetical protein
MRNLEDVGRRLDVEIERLKRFFKDEVKPTTERELVTVLRSAARHLEELARDLETHSSGGAKPKPSSAKPSEKAK